MVSNTWIMFGSDFFAKQRQTLYKKQKELQSK